MYAKMTRICISLPKEQAASIRSISKITKQPVSSIVREIVSDLCQSYETLVLAEDINTARERLRVLYMQADSALDEVDNADTRQ